VVFAIQALAVLGHGVAGKFFAQATDFVGHAFLSMPANFIEKGEGGRLGVELARGASRAVLLFISGVLTLFAIFASVFSHVGRVCTGFATVAFQEAFLEVAVCTGFANIALGLARFGLTVTISASDAFRCAW